MLNRVILMGRLTANPELKQTPSGISVTSFSVAVQRPRRKDAQPQTDFIDCVAWRNTAEFITRYFEKGKMIIIEGQIQTRTYEYNGAKRKAVEVLVDNAQFGESKGASAGGSSQPEQAPAFQEPEKGETFSVGDFGDMDSFEEFGTDDGDLPF